MPTYFVYHDAGALKFEQKQSIATAIVDAHVSSTNAPRFFVKVIFRSCDQGDMFSGGVLDQSILQVVGYIRTGRDAWRRMKLAKALHENIALHAWATQFKIGIQLLERPAENVFIEGAPMPQPGSDEETLCRELGFVPKELKQ
ncbi:hypothetical protein BKA93DRAFT_807194 [Sparassis latifolia]